MFEVANFEEYILVHIVFLFTLGFLIPYTIKRTFPNTFKGRAISESVWLKIKEKYNE